MEKIKKITIISLWILLMTSLIAFYIVFIYNIVIPEVIIILSFYLVFEYYCRMKNIEKNFSNRRKILEKIPEDSFYCYKPDKDKNAEDEKKGKCGVYHTKPCKYYKHKKGLYGKCMLYKCEIVDQVKDCGLRE